MEDDTDVVFVEVRFRNSERFGSAAESVTMKKQSKLRASAEHYLQRNPNFNRQPCRFDVLAISRKGSQNEINWIKNAF